MPSSEPVRTPALGSTSARAPDAPAAERLLVEAVLARDRKAAAEFVSTYADHVYAYVGRRLAPRRDLVDDLVQEVFLAAFDNLGRYQGTSPLRAWVLGIARHKVESYYRDQLRRPLPLEEDVPEPATGELTVEDLLDRSQARRKAQDVLRRLPEPYALALLWRYWENRSARQIAEKTGKTEKAVERLLARARARFRTLWEES